MQTVSATDLARNTRDILDTVASLGQTVGIERNHSLIAQIVPPVRTVTASQLLAGMTFAPLSPVQAANWLDDSRQGFSNEVRDPWA